MITFFTKHKRKVRYPFHSGKFAVLTVFLFTVFHTTLYAQDPENNATDANTLLWTGIELGYKLNKKWKLGFEEQFRFDNDGQLFDKSVTNLSIRRKMKKWWNLKLTFRYSADPDKRDQSRWTLDNDFTWDLKDNPVDLSYRFRYQNAKVSYTGQTISYLRNKFSIDVNMSKLVDPEVAYENFYRLDGKNEVRVHRIHFGLTWNLKRKWEMSTFFRIDQEVNRGLNQTQNIIGVSLSRDLN